MVFLLLVIQAWAYRPLTYKEIKTRFEDLSKTCPYLKLTTGQEEFGMAYPEDCENCVHYIVKIGNLEDKTVPQVYFSGCLHGDERVGPVVLTELAELLCNDYSKNTWLKDILDNHLIIMTPTTNAQGYFNHKREEISQGKWIDPNRDFPFDNTYSCGVSLTSQLIINIFNKYLVQAGITFHGGDNSLTYPWGAFLHYKNMKSTEAPDFQAFETISKVLLNYSKADVKVGNMNDVVYPVHGGLEDWAYGGGWDIEGQSKCGVDYFSNPEGLKQVFFLLEAHNRKSPNEREYGEKEYLWDGPGLVPQYIRMSLALVDLTRPYIKYQVLYKENQVVIKWEVWGAVDVIETSILHSEYNQTDLEYWNKTQSFSGGGRWGSYSVFYCNFSMSNFFFVITAKVDNWTQQIHPDPDVSPQTHLTKCRREKYKVSHNGFVIDCPGIVSTPVISTSKLAGNSAKADFGNRHLEILEFGSYIEVKNSLDDEELYIYKYGNPEDDTEKNSLFQEICKRDGKLKSGIYEGCSLKGIAGRLVEGKTSGKAVIESNPPEEVESFTKCFGQNLEITLESFDEDVLLVSLSGNFTSVDLEIHGKHVRIAKDQGPRFVKIKNRRVLGTSISILADSQRDSCIALKSKSFSQTFKYTKIAFPVWVVLVLAVLKVAIIVKVLYNRCKKKKQVQPKYQEIQLVITKH